MSSSLLNVAIVGGGPGGLTLACILNQLSSSSPNTKLSFKVFELEPSQDSRSQGGMLDVHRSSGQQAIKRAGLIEEFKKNMRIDATELHIRDNFGVAHLQYSEEEKGGYGEKGEVPDVERPEIDRKVLRSMLLNALPKESVEWGKKLVSISKSSSDDGRPQYTLHFADGSSAGGFHIVVGADGTWSKVRSAADALAESTATKPSSNPPYSGIICIDASITDAHSRHPDLVKFVGKGSLFSASRKTFLVSQLNGDGSLRTYYFFNHPSDTWDFEGRASTRGERALSNRTVEKGLFVKEYLEEWNETSKELLLKSDEDELLVRPLYEYPPGHTWKSPVPGITLLGDAAHVMTPFNGIGVNLALTDALDLSVAIEQVMTGSKSIEEAFKAFEEKMYSRATEQVTETFGNRETFLGKRLPNGEIAENEGIEKVVQRFTGQNYTQPTVEQADSKASEQLA